LTTRRDGKSITAQAAPTAAPMSWAGRNASAEAGVIPVKVSVKIRPSVTAGLAKLVEEVKKYAAVM
jgi:hypothetical protein